MLRAHSWLCLFLGHCFLLLGCNSGSPYRPPGDMEFPVNLNAVSYQLQPDIPLSAELIIEQGPRKLLKRIDSIEFEENTSAEYGAFYRLSQLGVHFAYYDSGDVSPTKRGLYISGDKSSTSLMRLMFDYLIEGIEAGEWRGDPGLRDSTDMGPGDYFPYAGVCDVLVGLSPSPDAQDVNIDLALATGRIKVGVYYEKEDWVPDDEDNPPKGGWNPITTPRVYIVSNRTRSHIFVLGQEWGRKLHDAALELYLRLEDLSKQLSQED